MRLFVTPSRLEKYLSLGWETTGAEIVGPAAQPLVEIRRPE